MDNGDRLEVLERGRRFLRVRTEKGVVGWIDEKATVPQTVFDDFEALRAQNAPAVPVASGVVRDEVYLHVKPGRETEKLFRLNEGEKLRLLRRATLEKALPPGQRPVAPTPVTRPGKARARQTAQVSVDPDVPPPPPMEDWWLVRLADGRSGWLLGRMVDVDAPDSLTRYSEGQRFVGAYVLRKVNDPEAPMEDKDVPEWVTVLSPYKSGLPYDFDQVRVFVWNVHKHRYETGFRQKNIEGYLPVGLALARDPYARTPQQAAPAPTFYLKVLPADVPPPTPDGETGLVTPARTITKVYRLEGNIVRRILPPNEPPPEDAHPYPVEEKKRRGRR